MTVPLIKTDSEPDGACAPSGTFSSDGGCVKRAGRGEDPVPLEVPLQGALERIEVSV